MKRCVAGTFVAVLAVLAVLALAAFALPAGALVPDGDQGWYWHMPQPVGGQLADVAFSSATSVWAVGGGQILHSTDAGVTWAVRKSWPGADLLSVAFAGDQDGIACGRQGTSESAPPLVLVTEDGGATWSDATPDEATGALQALSMTDADHAWIAGLDGQLWTTADGGATWTRRAVGSYGGQLTAATADGIVGWAGGSAGRIWRTLDGGATWTRQTTGLTVRSQVIQVACTDAEHAWAVALEATSSRLVSKVLATADGGATWRVVFRSGTELAMDVHAVGQSEAWVATADFAGLLESALGFGAFGSTSRLRHTVDGGFSWTTSTINSTSAPYALSANGESLCAVGTGILTSSDGGQTWRCQTSGGSYLFMAAEAVSTTGVWAVDLAGAVVHSADGVRWDELAAPQRWSQILNDLSFPDAEHGWIVGATADRESRPLILHTADGGATWSEQRALVAGELTGVEFVDEANGWAIAESPSGGRALQHTSDGGATWTLQRPRGILGLAAIDFLEPTTGWVSGQYLPDAWTGGRSAPAAVFRTTDGGATWTRHPLPRNTRALQLQFLDEHNGWGILEKSTLRSSTTFVARTSDAGATWTRLDQLGDGWATRVHFLDAMTGWAAVLGEGVYATGDGGATWRHQADSYATLALAAGDATHVWAFGLGSLVGTVDSNADTAPPSTFSDADGAWRSTAQTVTLVPNDVGAAGLGGTEYSLDGGENWQDGTVISFDAPADHANDGSHELLYRSTDLAGNREATQLNTVNLDTLGPTCSAPKEAVVNAGSSGILRFWAGDATSGVRRATITLSDRSGRVRRTFVKRAGNWGAWPAPTYYWMRFACDLKPGRYRITVQAVDRAGNAQVKVGHNWLRVVRRGAPKAHRPWWPAGLPDSQMTVETGVGGAAPSPRELGAAATSSCLTPRPWVSAPLLEDLRLR
jgi:photosystem II stability/assembly factor-like uncharacterized protein